jgi:peptidoglycan/LPS O-acetylase OafA/YrhL
MADAAMTETQVATMAAKPRETGRDFYIDRLRSVMTALVILHHVAITYGASGGWFWSEQKPSAAPASLLLTLFVTTNQAYFMGFFFLLAGYFTPGALERKGYTKFIGDRLLRLGVPLLAFGLLIGPATAGVVNAWEGKGFWRCIQFLWEQREFINGPLWFAQALLIFSVWYCAWRAMVGAELAGAKPAAVPSYWKWLLGALGTGLTALAIRQFVPVGKNIFGLQLAYFAGYIFLFAVGIAAHRHDWLRRLTWRDAKPWIWTSVIAWPLMPVGIVLAIKLNGPGKSNFAGGLSWTAIFYAMWEPFVAWGLMTPWLLVFRARMNQPSAFWNWLNRRAYAVYVIHPLLLVSIALLLHPWAAPALVKFVVTGALTCVACWLAADPLVRLPGVRRVL